MPKTSKNKKNSEKDNAEGSENAKNPQPSMNTSSLLQEEVKKLQEEVKEHKSKYLNLLAELENSRKRMQKEKSESNKFAISNVMSEFIQPIDNFENALNCADNMSDEIKNWAMGFKMILDQLKSSLANQGIKPFSSLGEQFDPHKHEAMETIEDESKEEGLITKEFVKGYMIYDRVLRPAKVEVVKRPSPKQEEGQEAHNEQKEEEPTGEDTKEN
ncbi:MAG: nucleotide exchange factor GrpE [Chlamydiales bacterium]|nr:nucleotide exchange factor GrpE [Chlamydiales bacterium]